MVRQTIRVDSALPAVLVLLTAILGAALRFYCLDCHGLWRDEVYTIEHVRWATGVQAFTGRLFLAPLIAWLTIQPVDPAETAVVVRLPSAIGGSLLVPVVYGLGRELFGHRQGLLAALLTALSAPLLDHSQEARTYGVVPLLTAVAVYCLLRFERTGAWGWVAGLAAVMSVNLVYSNTVLFVVVPTLAPLVAWVVWRAGVARLGRKAVLAGISMACLGVAAAILRYAPEITATYVVPELSSLSTEQFAHTFLRQLTYFTQFGLGPVREQLIEVGFLLLIGYGACRAIGADKRRGAYLCLMGFLIPALLLGAFSATSAIYPRYALFAIIFYLLLIAQGVVALCQDLDRRFARSHTDQEQTRPIRPLVWAPVVALAALFGTGAVTYHSTAGHELVSYRPDLRGVARYLSAHAEDGDMVVFVGWDDAVSQFYWKDRPPAPVYLASDPLLPHHRSRGAIFWVIEGYGHPLPQAVRSHFPPEEVVELESVAVIRQAGGAREVLGSLENLVRAFVGVEGVDPAALKSLWITHGVTLQARGDVASAAAVYQRTPMTDAARTLARAYLPAAHGWMHWGGGDPARAWREANVVRYHDPAFPEVYRTMAALLRLRGNDSEAVVADQIADLLAESALRQDH